MSSAEARRLRPMWLRIAGGYWVSFGFLFLLTAAGVLLAILHHHVSEYHENLALLSADLVSEYGERGYDVAKMKRDFLETVEENGSENVFLVVSDSVRGIVLKESSSDEVAQKMHACAFADGRTYRISAADRDGRPGGLAVRVRKTRLPDGRVLSVGYNVADDERHARQVVVLLVLSCVFMILAGGIVGAVLARRFTAPLRVMADAARQIERGDYAVRVAATGESQEIAELESAFGKMCAEIGKTLTELRVLTDNMAHDLRTPLTRLRAAAELRMMEGDGRDGLAETVLEETDAMLGMVNMMLEISQTEFGISRMPPEQVDLAAFVKGMVDLYTTLAEDKGIALAAHVPDGKVVFLGHKGRLQQLVGNLLDNAIKFTPDGGAIDVRLFDSPIAIEVSNTGPGIAADDIPYVFKRFWRADSSRSLCGNGLGLALVSAIAAFYGGRATCSSVPGETTTFRVEL